MNRRESEPAQRGDADLTSAIPIQGHPAMGDILKGMGNRVLCDGAITHIGTKEQA